MKECAENPNEKDNGAQDFNGNDLGVAEKSVEIERLFGLAGAAPGGIYS
jgi:hypothetical protein